jgi:4-methyl-5(b-hydroxyethyl)-thiazole monophosphate biosynthesis
MEEKITMKKKIAVILADGFEEIEAIVPVDVLRRLEIEVVSRTIKDGSRLTWN